MSEICKGSKVRIPDGSRGTITSDGPRGGNVFVDGHLHAIAGLRRVSPSDDWIDRTPPLDLASAEDGKNNDEVLLEARSEAWHRGVGFASVRRVGPNGYPTCSLYGWRNRVEALLRDWGYSWEDVID